MLSSGDKARRVLSLVPGKANCKVDKEVSDLLEKFIADTGLSKLLQLRRH